ncbi:hypothetical protein GQ457_10G020670 [Hibiscus cannabinus]
MGLEASELQFIWVVRKQNNDDDWLPEGFEKRMEGKGLVIRRWTPQVGGFMTHCGWNSTLEGVCGGVLMVTWPARGPVLMTQVLKIGVSVGTEKWVKREAIEKEMKEMMKGKRAKKARLSMIWMLSLKDSARVAIETYRPK